MLTSATTWSPGAAASRRSGSRRAGRYRPAAAAARAAHAALKSLTSQDFGPAKDASAKDRTQAMEAWKEWSAKQERK